MRKDNIFHSTITHTAADFNVVQRQDKRLAKLITKIIVHQPYVLKGEQAPEANRAHVRLSSARPVRAYLLVERARTACGVRAPLRLYWLKGGNAHRPEPWTPPLALPTPLSSGPPLVTLTREHYGLKRRITDLRYDDHQTPTHWHSRSQLWTTTYPRALTSNTRATASHQVHYSLPVLKYRP